MVLKAARVAASLAAFFLLGGCGELTMVGSPFGTQTKTRLRGHNATALADLRAAGAGKTAADTIRIGLVADNHQNYKDFENVIKILNGKDLDFIVHLGDLTNISLNSEYDAAVRVLNKSRHPVLVIPGNHDTIGAGIDLFREIFGDFNKSFDYAGRSFVLYNSNSLEFMGKEGYSPSWLKSRLAAAAQPLFVFQHVNYDNKTHFNSAEIADMEAALTSSPELHFVFNGHLHAAGYRAVNDFHVTTIPRSQGGRYGLFEIQPNLEVLHHCRGDSCDEVASIPR